MMKCTVIQNDKTIVQFVLNTNSNHFADDVTNWVNITTLN
jgi:hypothetical protein